MTFMTRYVFLIVSILSSCSQLPLAYAQNFSEVNKVIFGFPEYDITQERFEEYEYSFAKVKFNRGPHSIVILAYIDEGIYEWAGTDNVRIFTKNGRIIKTSGLNTDFQIRSPGDHVLLASMRDDSVNKKSRFSLITSFIPSLWSTKQTEVQEHFEAIDLYKPDLFNATLRTSYTSYVDELERFGEAVNVTAIEQIASIDSIAWHEKNYFYVDSSSGRVLKSSQKLHPRLTRVSMEFFYKF